MKKEEEDIEGRRKRQWKKRTRIKRQRESLKMFILYFLFYLYHCCSWLGLKRIKSKADEVCCRRTENSGWKSL